MIDQQTFTQYPHVTLRLNKDLLDSNAIPGIEIKRIIWGNLLGIESNELEETILLNSEEFAGFIEQSTEDFVGNYANLKKYPRFEDSDWDV